ncbi:hypothetical protein FKM82_009496 [Ascaphus truei]
MSIWHIRLTRQLEMDKSMSTRSQCTYCTPLAISVLRQLVTDTMYLNNMSDILQSQMQHAVSKISKRDIMNNLDAHTITIG